MSPSLILICLIISFGKEALKVSFLWAGLFRLSKDNKSSSAQEPELAAARHAVKYAISEDITNAIFWTDCGAFVEGFYRNVTFVNIDLLPHMNKLKMTCKKYDYIIMEE